MAYTNQNIIDAYNQAMAGGASEADFVSKAQSMGISNDQLASARTQLMSSPAPAPATNVVDRFSPEQYSAAQQWANGKTADQIFGKASELGLTSDELGKVFGKFGGSGKQVTDMTGYGSGITGFNPDGSFKWGTSFAGGVNADGSKQSDWTFDSVNGWTKAAAKKPGTTGPNGMPTTGINLSQLQTATPWEVSKNQTVANQIEQIIAADSPLMQQARMRALQAANQRGLLNSSMAVSAGESALYDAAMPIAQQDASTYADSARFNADASNTFSRDNNAFVRDAFMADFNLAANEWAKQQDQIRRFAELDYGQRLTLERDAIQNGYQSARDAILNGYTIARDDNNNAFTLKRDNNQNTFTAGQNQLDRDSALQRTAAGQSPDTSVQRTQMQIDADRDRINADKVQTATANLNNYKVKWGTSIIDIQNSNLSKDQKTASLIKLTDTYAPIVASYATQAGLDPEGAMANLRFTAEPAASTNVVNTVATNIETQGPTQ
jgi:hypothetical protein